MSNWTTYWSFAQISAGKTYELEDCYRAWSFCKSKMIFWTQHNKGQKAVVFIVGKKNPATQNLFIPFFIENLIANINSYAFSWPKLNFGCYLTYEIIF